MKGEDWERYRNRLVCPHREANFETLRFGAERGCIHEEAGGKRKFISNPPS